MIDAGTKCITANGPRLDDYTTIRIKIKMDIAVTGDIVIVIVSPLLFVRRAMQHILV